METAALLSPTFIDNSKARRLIVDTPLFLDSKKSKHVLIYRRILELAHQDWRWLGFVGKA